MLAILQKAGRACIGILQHPLERAFGRTENPMNHLGSLAIFFCWIVLVSGIWLLIFFRTSVSGAFESLEYLSREQWYLGGIMRSLHRYASDAVIVVLLLHVVREFSNDRYRGNRWFSWITGTPVVWMVFVLGITGYWLVWDELAQYVAITSAELLDRIPIFTASMASNFLTDAAMNDRFFTLMAFLHLIGLPIFLVFGIWLHVFRLSGPAINPPRSLMAGSLLCMLLLSLVFPAQSQQKADLSLAPQLIELDWLYLHFYPLVQLWSPGAVWMLLLGISAMLMVAPWLPPARTRTAAQVDLDNCNGCNRCADDCPFGAIEMRPRTDGASYSQEAFVDPDLCVSCGICVGACPTATPFRKRSDLLPGIDLPSLAAVAMKQRIEDVAAGLSGQARVLCFVCRGNRYSNLPKDTALVEVECMGQVPPSFFDYILKRDVADGIVLAGCPGSACRYRLGEQWTDQRIERVRDPMLRKRVDSGKILRAWGIGSGGLAQHLHAFARSLNESHQADIENAGRSKGE